jgi:hypothetical protein
MGGGMTIRFQKRGIIEKGGPKSDPYPPKVERIAKPSGKPK